MQRGVFEIFTTFLKLGLTSFGGPVAHLGFFREALVEKRKWLSDTAFADLVALCQFIPGPASSQVGIGIGLSQCGLRGALAAWLGFTLPSAIAMAALGIYAGAPGAVPAGSLAALKVLAVAVVAQAVLGMAKSLCPDAGRATLAAAAMAVVLAFPVAWVQVAVIAAGALAGGLFFAAGGSSPAEGFTVPAGVRRLAVPALLLFGGFLAWALLAPAGLAAAHYGAGALVFGGGHVVLPLLESEVVPGLVSRDAFLAGYGAAQGIPGPLFTLSSFLGGAHSGWYGAATATLAVFLPSFFLVVGAAPYWSRLVAVPRMRGAVAGANAAVVGILGAAFYDPVFTSGVQVPVHAALAAGFYVALTQWKVPPWALVLAAAGGGAFFG